MRVIVVEDNILFCDYICNFLQNADYQTVKAYRLAQARQVIARSVREDDIVLADLRLPDGESTALLEWMREQGYTHPFIMMTNYEEIHTAVHAMKLGAEDYILKPLLEDKLLPALKKIRMADEAFAKVIYERKSAAFRELDRYIRLVAPTDMTVLILGNTGTGKEHLAGKIHKRSLRANKPYITVDCGSLSRELAASAFFGHVKGAFTGATDEKPGYFQEARGGTLFLDEVENLPVEIQQMLLRAMEERRYRPVGGRQDKRMDVRVIAATNEDLQDAVAEKRFRKDLLYRLQDFTITVPTLQDCLEDILPLADFFRIQSAGQLGKEIPDFDEAAKKILLGYGWPGNVRELKQVVHAAVLICGGKLITPQCLRLQQAGKTVLNLAKEEKINNCLLKGKYSINSLVYWVTYVHNVVYSFYRSMIYCYINSTQRCAGSIVIDIIPTNGADKRKFFPFAPYFPVTNVIKRYFYPYFPAIIGIKGYSFPYFPYLSGIMKIKTALYSLFSRLDWHKTVVFPCLGEIYEGIRSLSWEIPVT